MKILLLDSDPAYCQNLMNSISCLSSEVCISFIAHSVEEIRDTFDPDIIFADYEFCSEEFEREFSECPIIYLSEEPESHPNTISKTNIDLIIKTAEDNNKAFNDSNLEKQIVCELSFLGYNFAHIGTQLLIEALKMIYETGEACYSLNLQQDIYPDLCEKFNLTIRSIKANINYSTNKMLDECEKKKIYSYLGFRFSRRPGSKTVMCSILEKIKLRI